MEEENKITSKELISRLIKLKLNLMEMKANSRIKSYSICYIKSLWKKEILYKLKPIKPIKHITIK